MVRFWEPITADRIDGQTRLEDLKDDFNGRQDDFYRAVMDAVERQEIGLVPVGETVHVQPTDREV